MMLAHRRWFRRVIPGSAELPAAGSMTKVWRGVENKFPHTYIPKEPQIRILSSSAAMMCAASVLVRESQRLQRSVNESDRAAFCGCHVRRRFNSSGERVRDWMSGLGQSGRQPRIEVHRSDVAGGRGRAMVGADHGCVVCAAGARRNRLPCRAARTRHVDRQERRWACCVWRRTGARISIQTRTGL